MTRLSADIAIPLPAPDCRLSCATALYSCRDPRSKRVTETHPHVVENSFAIRGNGDGPPFGKCSALQTTTVLLPPVFTEHRPVVPAQPDRFHFDSAAIADQRFSTRR